MAPPPAAPPKWMVWIATWFGCGYAKKAPGTIGSLGAVPLFLLVTPDFPEPALACSTRLPQHLAYWGGVVLVAVLGVVCSQRVAGHAGAKDPQQIVIDEVAGTLIALGTVQCSTPLAWGVAWLAFRVLDIWKPWPISLAERAKPLGLGIMLDDLLAGGVAGAIAGLIFGFR